MHTDEQSDGRTTLIMMPIPDHMILRPVLSDKNLTQFTCCSEVQIFLSAFVNDHCHCHFHVLYRYHSEAR